MTTMTAPKAPKSLTERFVDWPATEMFVLGILIVGAKTVQASVLLMDVFAYGLMALAAFIAFLRAERVVQRLGYAFFPTCLFLLGIFLGQQFTNFNLNYNFFFETLVSIVVGSLIIVSEDRPFSKKSGAIVFGLGTILYIILTIAVGGLAWNGLPYFEFERYSDSGVRLYEVYSQGVTKLMAFGSIFSIYAIMKLSASKTDRLFFVFCLALFFSLSLFGGSRGEFIALIFVMAVMVASGFGGMSLIFGLVFVGLVLIVPSELLQDVVLLNRLEALADDQTFGGRQELFSLSIDLLQAESGCLIHGCGLFYFQNYWGFILGYYPHNYILEFTISYGIFATFFIYVIYISSVLKTFRHPEGRLISLILIFLFIISMKSSSPAIDHLFWVFFSYQLMVVLGALRNARIG